MASPAAVETTREEWLAMGLDAIEGVLTGTMIVADDVRAILPRPPHDNLMGALFMTAKHAGLITPVGHATSTAKTRRHGTQRVWVRM